MTKSRKIIVLLVALVGVCVSTFAVSRYQRYKEEIKESGETVLSIETQDVTKVNWENESGQYSFTKEGEEWKYDDDDLFPVSTEKMEEMLSYFNDFGADFVIENVTDFAQYGLENPVATIHIETSDETYDISLGDYSQIDAERYVSFGGNEAYLAVHDPMDEFSATSDDLIDNDTIPDFESIESMSVKTDSEDYNFFYEGEVTYSYDRNDVYFAEVDDDTKALSTEKVETYLENLKNLELTDFVDYKVTDEELADYGLDTPDLTLEVWYFPQNDEKTQTLDAEDGIEVLSESFLLYVALDPDDAQKRQEILAEESDSSSSEESDLSVATDSNEEEEMTAYVRYGDSPIIYKISGDEYETLLKAGFNDLRHNEVMTATVDNILEIEISLEGSTYTMTAEKSGSGNTETVTWTLDGKEVDLEDLISAIHSASATEFTDDTDFGKEEIGLKFSITPDDEGNVDEVDISFYRYDGSTCLCMIDGETFGYVERADVVDIIEAVNAIVLD